MNKMCLSCGFIITNTTELKIRKKKCSRCKQKTGREYESYYICPRCGNNIQIPKEII